jgi:hypothetical protein
MIRETQAGNSRGVFVAMSAANGLQMLYRNSTGGAAVQSGATITGKTAPYWVKLVRAGNVFTGYVSPDNVTWTQIGSPATVAMSTTAFVGLALTSHTTTTLNTGKFDSVTVSNSAPTVATAAAATPSPVTNKTANLSVLGADDHGEANLTYTWAATAAPAGGGVTFSANGSNAAKASTATFSRAGAYVLACTITDSSGVTATSSVSVLVNATLTAFVVSPLTATVDAGGTLQFTAGGMDQFGVAMAVTPTWSVDGAGNTINSNGLFTAASDASGAYTVTAMNGTFAATAAVTVNPVVTAATIAGRWLFYNNTSFDGNDAGAGTSDDGAIGTDKAALLPGATATPANYSGSLKGINGIMIDVAGLPATGVTAADFTFAMGNDDAPDGWAAAPTPTSVTVRPGAGANGSDRITLIWDDGAIVNQWLKVSVGANVNTGLAAPDVFYFGNLIGDTGNNPSAFAVTIADIGLVRSLNGQAADVTSAADFNRSGQISIADVAIGQANNGHTLTVLTAPAAAPAAAPVAIAAAAVPVKPGVARANGMVVRPPIFSTVAMMPARMAALPTARKRSDVLDG